MAASLAVAAPGLKVCGLTRAEDLRACAELGVDMVGLNFWPGSKRFLELDAGRRVLEQARGEHPAARFEPARVGVFVDAALDTVAAHVEAWSLAAIQPHGDAPVEPYAALAQRLGIAWVWVIRGTPALEGLRLPEPAPQLVLLDAAVPGYGGAGHRTDWDWAAQAVIALSPTPVWIAGGIHPGNVTEVLGRVRPAGVDLASGAEPSGARQGEKDRAAIAALVHARDHARASLRGKPAD